jgi:NAD(P)H-hydrate epimerase
VQRIDISEPQPGLVQLDNALKQKPSLIVDGLFGIGLSRPLDADWCQLIRRVNESHVPVLAADIPSGLNADSGEPQPEAIRAAVTLTVGAAKAGMLKQSAWPFVGLLEMIWDVGLLPCPVRSESQWILPEDFAGFPPAREAAAHKGTFGHLAIVAGSMGYHGAAVLAARGAQRAQPGLVTLFSQPDVYHAVAAQLQAVMVSIWRPDLKLSVDYDAVLFGPGLALPTPSEDLKNSVRRLWLGSTNPVVADASALDWIPLGPVSDKHIRVITPHPGEAARLLGCKVDKIQADRVAAVRDLSKRFSNCWVMLKGHQTLIGRSSGDIFVNSTGNPHLGQGGAGDALGGFLAGLLAQKALQADPLTTICYAVWQHGRAADKLTSERRNWTIEDLVEVLGNA